MYKFPNRPHDFLKFLDRRLVPAYIYIRQSTVHQMHSSDFLAPGFSLVLEIRQFGGFPPCLHGHDITVYGEDMERISGQKIREKGICNVPSKIHRSGHWMYVFLPCKSHIHRTVIVSDGTADVVMSSM